MKKILSILLIFVMMLTFASCGKTETEDKVKKDPNHINAADYQLVWYNVKEAETPDVNDNWEIETPYLCGGELIIDATVDFRDDVFFECITDEGNISAEPTDKENDGSEAKEKTEVKIAYGVGEASLNEDFSNPSNVIIAFADGSNGVALMDIPVKLQISIDTKELGAEKPEEIWYRLKTSKGEIKLILDLEWDEE